MATTTSSVPFPGGDLDTHDTSPPPLPPWLKGFLVTSRGVGDVRRAGEEVVKLCNDLWFRVGYNEHVPSSMVGEGAQAEVPYESAEALLVPGSPGSVFVALRPDNTTVDVRLIATALVEEAQKDKAGVEGVDKISSGWTHEAKHVQRIIPVERIAPETDLEQLAKKIVEEHFPALAPADRPEPLSSFRVHYEEHSAALHLHKFDVEKMIADMVPGDSYAVDLASSADKTILCITAGGSVMMSVVKGYDEKMHHFHIHSAPTTTA